MSDAQLEQQLQECITTMVEKEESSRTVAEDLKTIRQSVKELNEDAGNLMAQLNIEEYTVGDTHFVRRAGVVAVKLKSKRTKSKN